MPCQSISQGRSQAQGKKWWEMLQSEKTAHAKALRGDVCREKTGAAGMEASGMRQAWRAEDQRVHVKVFGVLGGRDCGQIHDVRIPLFPSSVYFWHGVVYQLQV